MRKKVDDWVGATERIVKQTESCRKVELCMQVLPLEVQKVDCKRNLVAVAFFI